jgi:hypothetical protein
VEPGQRYITARPGLAGRNRAPGAAAEAALTPAAPVVLTQIRGQTGFWRIAQTQDGIWWFISPTGKLEFLNTVTTVQPYQPGRDSDGPGFISKDWTGGMSAAGDLERWAKATLPRVQAAGFKGLGAWSNPAFAKLDVPMSRDLNLRAWIGDGVRLYSPAWAEAAERAIAAQVVELRANKQIVGYYTDNELDWSDQACGPAKHFDGLALDDPNRQQVIQVIRSLWPTVQAFNKDWNTSLKDWRELDTMVLSAVGHDSREARAAYARLASAWLAHLAKDYFRITSGLIRKYDPNHLILGVRFKGYAPREVVRAARDDTDVQSINYYVGDALLDLEQFNMIHELSGQPVIISEYAFHSLDGRSGNRNTFGFSAQVLDQQARAEGYRLFTTRAARVPYIIGADWFQWFDEPPSGRSADGEDVNFGIVDIDDRPYGLLVNAVRETTPQLNPLHTASAFGSPRDMWRESFADKPLCHVPYLTTPIVLNGELSDWPPQAKVQNVRHSQTVGLERSPMPIPNVYLGWREEGLYLGFEVFDNDIDGSPAKGWWWTKDCVEWWISTQPVARDQDGYDPYCHQYFFVPQDPALNSGIAGAVGQWHRPGDALDDSVIPQPLVKHAERLLADRYVVEVFIPAKALSGFDPGHQPVLAFNFHTRNYQHAIDCFWSAPKELMTQMRPSTWGTLYLSPKTTKEHLTTTRATVRARGVLK